MTRAAACLALLALCAGCASTQAAAPLTRVETVPVAPPAALLTCRDAPSAPDNAQTQREVAGYIVRLHAAGQDCRDKLGAVRSWVLEETTP